jgi:hypothetical protein
LLDSEKSTATLYEIQTLREGINELREENERRAAREDLDRHNRRLVEIKEKIQPPNYRSDQLFITEVRHGWSFGRWFFEHDTFRAWYDRGSPDGRALFVHGKPGAGE